MLEAATELVTERGHTVVRDTDVDDAYGRARHKSRIGNVQSLPYHQQVRYALLERLIEDAQKIHQQRPILQETLATATQPRCEA
ncbi:hypothetical protein HLRTI_002329 [Halorhabdus tiamatea SARL4B]|nr:hypothetical protein [Halorhabdus tiamatea]ERJ05707.1 hypothetical protein HLRTI_002329 [Halorhabdus tiamatea SARL4B]